MLIKEAFSKLFKNHIFKSDYYRASKDDLGLHGEAYGALWDKSYWDIINKRFKIINQLSSNRRNPEIRNQMNQKILEYEYIVLRNRNDQTVYDDLHHRRLDTEETSFGLNTVTNDGMTQLALLACNETVEFFDYDAYGAGNTKPELTDLILEQEVGRVSIAAGAGYHSGAGTSIKHAGIFAEGFESADIVENGAFTQPDANTGVMLFRATFEDSEALHHEKNQTFFTLAHTIYMSSI